MDSKIICQVENFMARHFIFCHLKYGEIAPVYLQVKSQYDPLLLGQSKSADKGILFHKKTWKMSHDDSDHPNKSQSPITYQVQ